MFKRDEIVFSISIFLMMLAMFLVSIQNEKKIETMTKIIKELNEKQVEKIKIEKNKIKLEYEDKIRNMDYRLLSLDFQRKELKIRYSNLLKKKESVMTVYAPKNNKEMIDALNEMGHKANVMECR